MASEVTASLSPIDPNTLFSDGFELADQSIIPNENVTSAFIPYEDKVEFWVYDFNKNLIGGEYNFEEYNLIQNPNSLSTDVDNTSTVALSPIENTFSLGFNEGKLFAVYNFIRYQLSSSPDNRYYLAEISSDRTEIRLKSNILTDEEITNSFNQLKQELDSLEYFDEFYISFGDNEYNIGVNLKLDITEETPSVLIKLYDPLPANYSLKDELYVVTKVAESLAYQVEYPELIDVPSNVTFLQGPNTNLEIKDFINNSTELKSKSELTNTQSSSSKDNLSNVLNRKGVTITPNYSYNTFNEFVNFSSAKRRIENFVEKVEQIQSYEADIESLTSITGSTSSSFEVSSSIASAYTNIENLIKNFDGYEYYLYYNTSSFSYPKTGSSFPYTLLSTTDPTVLQWLGSDIETSQYYGGVLLSASLYDENNQNWLYYTIPEFIRDNEDNDQYLEFSNMVGQHFDEIWLYTKAVSEKNNTTSDLDSGVPLQLADDVISSLGYKGFGNNYNNQDNFIGLTGENNGSYIPPTGSEVIDNYIAVNGGSIVNYWADNYSYEFYVESLEDPGYPYAIDRVSKEIFKRLYHNMAYLVKKKGTISGLRQLINIWGIPNTILRINEFGGKNKDNSDDYDLWYNRYSYAFTPVSTQNLASASVSFPWMPLERNRIVDSEYIVPDSLQFRFKTTGYPSSSYVGEFFTQSLLVKKSDGDDTSTDFDFGVALYYDPPTTGSYSGSTTSEYEDWGTMKFYISGAAADGGVAVSDDIYLPFFNKEWWSIMLQRDTHVSASDNSNATTYTLYAKNKIYNGWDGNSIGFEGSASIVSNVSSSVNEAWNKFGTTSADGIYLGGFISGSQVGGITLNDTAKIFSGSLQEFRYYSVTLSESIFNDFVMNPESIEGINITGSLSSFDILNFRAPLGNELESIFTSSFSSSYSESMVSMHPAVTGAAELLITSSFVNPSGDITSSVYDILYYENTTTKTYSKTNTEVYFLDQPAIGLRNRISNKIQIDNAQDYGTTLSSLRTIQQDYQISRSYTEDINSLEVAFSPQDEVNDDIIQTFGFGVVADALADPRFISSSDDYYPKLRKTAEEYFEKYTKGNVYDYLRLIKYFDNSIFKAIKNYVPARTSVSTGIVIKQHLLERNRYPQPKLTEITKIAVTPSGGLNTPINVENLELTSSISIGSFSGGAGGSVNQFNVPAGLLRLQDNNVSSTYTLTSGSAVTAFTHPLYSFIDTRTTFLEVSQSVVAGNYGFPNPADGIFTNITDYDFVGDVQFSIFNQPGSSANITIDIVEIGTGVVASQTLNFPSATTTYARGGQFNGFRLKARKAYYITMTSDTTVTVRRLQFSFEGHPKQFWTGQVYNNYNNTVVGLLTDVDQREEEFYNGEYSGSNLIATTQSLFNNPFLLPSTVETIYTASVISTGLTPYARTTPTDTTFDLRIGSPTIANVTSHIQTNMTAQTSSVVWVSQSIENPDIWYVTAVALAQADGYAGGWPSLRNDNPNINDVGVTLYPPPPYSSYSWGDDESRTFIPYFVFSLPRNDGGYLFDNDSEGLSFQIITSFGLVLDKNDLPNQGKIESNFSSIPTRMWTFNPLADQHRPIIIDNGTTYPLTAQVYNGTAPGIDLPDINFIPSSQVAITLNNIPSVSAGEAKLGFAGTTFFATSSEGIDYLVPAYLRIHNEDTTGNFNAPSFQLQPELQIPLTITGSSRNDGTGVSTNVFDTSLVTSFLFKNYNQNGLFNTFKYSDTNGFGLSNRPNTLVGTNFTSLVNFDPFIDPNTTIVFENSDFFATINNFNNNRSNSYLMNIEYENGINTPSNLPLILNRTAEKTQTPDSNYTMKKVTIPRYEGSKLTSADYNFYNAGDISYGKTATIDKRPIYFAHFKTSQFTPSIFNTVEYTIDSLIEVPFEDIQGTNYEPKSLQVEGNNERLSEIVSTFEKTRQASAVYESNLVEGVNYKSLKSNLSLILNPGSEYIVTSTNQRSETEISLTWSYNRFTDEVINSSTFPLTGSEIMMVTGSGHLILSGSKTPPILYYDDNALLSGSTNYMGLGGPYLAVFHDYNYCLKNGVFFPGLAAPNFSSSGVVEGINPEDDLNYIRFNSSQSGLSIYDNLEEPFLIERGDEIRVTYSYTTFGITGNTTKVRTQDFQVLGIEQSTYASGSSGNNFEYCNTASCFFTGTTGVYVYDKVLVYPDPSTLTIQIPDGNIKSFTVRKRFNADDKVVLSSSPPSGSKGASTKSKGGYLIPNDLTPTQKRNVNTLINQLKAKNAFRDDDNNQII